MKDGLLQTPSVSPYTTTPRNMCGHVEYIKKKKKILLFTERDREKGEEQRARDKQVQC